MRRDKSSIFKPVFLMWMCLIFLCLGSLAPVAAQVPIGDTRSGTLTVDGAQINGTNPNYVVKVTDAAGTEFTDSMGFKFSEILTGGVSSSSVGALIPGAYFYTVPIFKAGVQALGAVANSTAYIRVFRSGAELTVTTPANGQITVTEGASDYNFNIVATTPLPVLTMTYGLAPGTPIVSGGTVPFGTVTVGTLRNIQFSFKNEGPAGTTLSVTGMTLNGADAARFGISAPEDFNIVPGTTRSISFSYTPTDASANAANVTFNANTGVGLALQQKIINLTGTGQFEATALLVQSGDDPAFGSQKVNTNSALKVFTITNNGTYNLVIGAVTLAGANANQFTKTADTCANQTVAPAGTCSITARFNPTSGVAGAKTATITILSNTGKVEASGSKNTPDVQTVINLTGTETDQNIVPPGAIPFGDVVVQGTKTLQMVVHNGGNADLVISNVTTANPFSVNPTSGTVPAGGDASFNVTFSPGAAQLYNGTVTINSDDPDSPVTTVNVSGTGVSTAIGLSATSFDFGAVQLDPSGNYLGYDPPAPPVAACADRGNGTVDCVLTITNLAGGDLTGITLTGLAAPFSVVTEYGTTLASGVSENVTLRYTATSGSAAAHTDTLTVGGVSSAQSLSRNVSLTGITNTNPNTPVNTTPGDGSTNISLSPTLMASAYHDADGDAYAGARWTIKDGSGNTIFVTQTLNANTGVFSPTYAIGASDGANGATPQFTLPKGLLQYGMTYGFQVAYRDARGAIPGPGARGISATSPLTTFTTMAQVAGENAFGVPNSGANASRLTTVNTTNANALNNDAAFRTAVPQVGGLATIVAAGSVALDASTNLALNVGAGGGFVPVKSNGGTGQPLAFAASGTDTIANIQPINSAGQSTDSTGALQAVPGLSGLTIPAGVTLTYGLFDITVNVGAPGDSTEIVIVPPTPFPAGTKWYKVDPIAKTVVEYPNFMVFNGNGFLGLTDNGAGDSDPAPRVIRDPGGPALPPAAPAAGATIGESSSSGGCFIATAAFGSYFDPYVSILRNFRDVVLMTNGAGQAFVNWYYRVSPPVADFIAQSGTLKTSVRVMLLPAVGFAALSLKIGMFWSILLMMAAFAATIVALRKVYRLTVRTV